MPATRATTLEQRHAVMRLSQAGKMYPEIAQQMHLSYGVVRKWARRSQFIRRPCDHCSSSSCSTTRFSSPSTERGKAMPGLGRDDDIGTTAGDDIAERFQDECRAIQIDFEDCRRGDL